MARRAFALALTLALVAAPSAPSFAREATLEAVVTGLDFATNAAMAPDGRIFVAEKDTGLVRLVEGGELRAEPVFGFDVIGGGETGLLGLALHPGFPDEPWLYAYLSEADDGWNHLVRVRLEGNVGTMSEDLLRVVEATTGYHNGGDLAFGTDGMLYVSTGEAHEPERAQDPGDLGGKILRVTPGGGVPSDNPVRGSAVYASGIRNSFGLCVDPATGDVWETENGPDRLDELNRITAGANYGWPVHLGPAGADGYEDPILAYETVIVPTGCAVTADGSALYFGTFGGELHRVPLPVDGTPTDEIVARTDAGITDVTRGPDGAIYVVTTDAVLRLGGEAPSPSAAADGSSAPPTPSASSTPTPSPAAGTSDGLSPAAIVIGLVLIGGMFLLRARADRRRPPEP